MNKKSQGQAVVPGEKGSIILKLSPQKTEKKSIEPDWKTDKATVRTYNFIPPTTTKHGPRLLDKRYIKNSQQNIVAQLDLMNKLLKKHFGTSPEEILKEERAQIEKRMREKARQLEKIKAKNAKLFRQVLENRFSVKLGGRILSFKEAQKTENYGFLESALNSLIIPTHKEFTEGEAAEKIQNYFARHIEVVYIGGISGKGQPPVHEKKLEWTATRTG